MTPKFTILIIEDEKNIQTFVGKILKKHDYKVLYADNGREMCIRDSITAPPENAMDSALFIPLSFAAFAVLTFAFVATFIPKYPASVENNAPTTKHTACLLYTSRCV